MQICFIKEKFVLIGFDIVQIEMIMIDFLYAPKTNQFQQQLHKL